MIFALPYMFSNLLQVFYGSADMFVVGQFGHTFDVSGVSIGSQTMSLITNLVLGLTTGVTVLLGQYLGSKSYRDLSKTIGGAIVLFLIIALGLTFVMLSFNNEITLLMNTPKEAIEATKSYLSICSAGIIFIVGYNVVSSILRGLGDSKTPLLFVFIACMINIVVDFVLVGYFHLGTKGAAIALGSALASLIALNVGAKQTLKYAIMISLAFAIVVTTICEIDGTILTRIFTNNQDVIKNGALYLKTYSIDCLLTSFLFCINGYLNGYEKTVFTMVHSLVATFIGRIPLTLLFSNNWIK